MPDTSKCFSLVRGRAMRVSKLDGCGNPVFGPTNTAVSDGFITVGFAAQTDAGTTISITNAAGKVCISDEPAPTFTGYEITVEFCGVNPDLFSLMTGQPLVMDSAGTQAVGFGMDTAIDADDSAFALEVWSNVPTAACAPGSGVSYGYLLVPFLKGGIIGDFTIANDAVNFTLSGAKSKDGNAWGVGPYNVVDNGSGVAGPLNDAISSTRHLHVEVTTIAPPTEVCGAIAFGVPATSAVAGIPGHYLPTNSYGRANLAAMTGLTASPATAWTTGQYVTMLDGNKAHWSSSAWVAGPA